LRLREGVNAAGDRTPEVRGLIGREDQKRLLTEAVDVAPSQLRATSPLAEFGHRAVTATGATRLVFWRSTRPPPRTIVLLLSQAFLARSVWPSVFASARREDIDGALVAPDGRTPFASAAQPLASPASNPLRASRTLQDDEAVWRLEVWPRHPDALYGEVRRRQHLYLAMLVVMAASLGVAAVLTLRTVSRELEVARLKSQFVSAVSHEFRTPLTGIRQFAEMLLNDRVGGDDRRRHYYARILAPANGSRTWSRTCSISRASRKGASSTSVRGSTPRPGCARLQTTFKRLRPRGRRSSRRFRTNCRRSWATARHWAGRSRTSWTTV
jgi:signal transduction histidine kinase